MSKVLSISGLGFPRYTLQRGNMEIRNRPRTVIRKLIPGLSEEFPPWKTRPRPSTTGRPVYLPRPDTERFSSATTRRFFDIGMKTLYAVPIIVHGRRLGGLMLASSREDALSKTDKELFQEIGKRQRGRISPQWKVRLTKGGSGGMVLEFVGARIQVQTERWGQESIPRWPASDIFVLCSPKRAHKIVGYGGRASKSGGRCTNQHRSYTNRRPRRSWRWRF